MPNISAPNEQHVKEHYVLVGFVRDAFGIRGALRITPFSSDPVALLHCPRWFIQPMQTTGIGIIDHNPSFIATIAQQVDVTQVKRHQEDELIVQFKAVTTRNQADTLKGYSIWIHRNDFPPTAPDEYYWVDLIGCTVVNLQGQTLGTLKQVSEKTVQGVLEITPVSHLYPANTANPLIQIPFVDALVPHIDLAQRRITVDWSIDALW
jgi:16S rRNA processing protein RimM